jgi:hypothetical protein
MLVFHLILSFIIQASCHLTHTRGRDIHAAVYRDADVCTRSQKKANSKLNFLCRFPRTMEGQFIRVDSSANEFVALPAEYSCV